MARAAGVSDHYDIGVIDATGQVKGRTVHFPSVTTILGSLPKTMQYWGFTLGVRGMRAHPDLTERTEWAAIQALKETEYWPDNVRGDAAERGTDVHELAEQLFTTGMCSTIPEHQGYVDALLKWYSQHQMEKARMLLVELPVFSITHRYAGTADAIFHHPKWGYCVLDVKTSKRIYLAHLLQPVAYGDAAIELGVIPQVDKHFVLAVHPDGTFDFEESDYTIDDFLVVKSLWELERRDKQRIDAAIATRNGKPSPAQEAVAW